MLVGILLVIGILTFFLIRWSTKLVGNDLKKIEDEEPFEFTEMSKLAPTPTPVISEKKKRGRKPKNTN
jgi:hypothetical protein